MTTAKFSCAATEQLLGSAAVEALDQQVATAPPLRPEQHEQLRAIFASVHVVANEHKQAA